MDISVINLANKDTLAKIPGIGEERAQKIMEYKDKIGGFKNWEDLKQIPGISDDTLKEIQNHSGGMEDEIKNIL